MFPYRQVIDAYPGGGGAYAVARATFPPGVSPLAAAALVADYTLSVAVSIVAGVASLISAFPGLAPATVAIALASLPWSHCSTCGAWAIQRVRSCCLP